MRIAPVIPGSCPALAPLEAAITAERGRISPLYQVLLNSPAMAHGWEQLLTAVRQRSSLPADVRELVILRVAVLNGAPYEFDAHVPYAKQAGVSDEAIAALQQTSIDDRFSGAQRQALLLTDAMTRSIVVPQDLFDAVRVHFDEQQALDLTVTIAAYNMVSRLLVALQIGH